jgi:hypothetical protein
MSQGSWPKRDPDDPYSQGPHTQHHMVGSGWTLSKLLSGVDDYSGMKFGRHGGANKRVYAWDYDKARRRAYIHDDLVTFGRIVLLGLIFLAIVGLAVALFLVSH